MLRSIVDPGTGEAIDRGLAVFFPAPASFTGEDCFELHLHGGRAVIEATLQALSRITGFRPAERGEFTRRAFVSGRYDLTEVEGLSDLIAAETQEQRRAAVEQSSGLNRKRYDAWAEGLTRARALIEAELDFSDEEGVAGAWADEGRESAKRIEDEMAAALSGYERMRLIREGLEIVIAGPVNAGKSTLLNAIAGREIAIVSDEPGTTRDLIEVPVDLEGRRATLIDSAGLREAAGNIEREGVRRAKERIATANLVLWVSELGQVPPGFERAVETPVWRVATKSDLATPEDLIRMRNDDWIALSGTTGDGVDDLLRALTDWAASVTAGPPAVVNRERHRTAVAESLEHLRAAIRSEAEEIAAGELRLATDAIGRITGRIDTERVLDIVFGEFCIGK